MFEETLSRRTLLGLLAATSVRTLFATNENRCPVCGMKFSPNSKTRFEAKESEKLHITCSYACAKKLKTRKPSIEVSAVDFLSGKTIASDSAFYLTRSEKLADKLEFSMPPMVVAFSAKSEAEKLKNELGEGVIVEGWKKLSETL